MQQKTNADVEGWDSVRAKERNYVNNKKGYRHMLNDIEGAEHNIKRIKGGLSIFDDEKIREHYLSKTNVPIMQKYHLSSNFQKVILNPIKNKNEDLSSQLRHINNSSSVGAASFLPGSLDLNSLASSF